MLDPLIAYCGPAPTPSEIWWRWNLDPVLLALLALAAYGVVRFGGQRPYDRHLGLSAIGLMVVVFVSPLCALSSALFSARVLHHVLLIAAAAPLLAMAFPLLIRPGRRPVTALAVIHAVILWVWHIPGIYAWGLETVAAYWLMQLSLLVSAWALWSAILAAMPREKTAAGTGAEMGGALIALVGTIAQMGMLGALIVFAPEPLYAVHFFSTVSWGLSPQADQQLAGLLMWVPAAVPYVIAGLWILWSALDASETSQ